MFLAHYRLLAIILLHFAFGCFDEAVDPERSEDGTFDLTDDRPTIRTKIGETNDSDDPPIVVAENHDNTEKKDSSTDTSLTPPGGAGTIDVPPTPADPTDDQTATLDLIGIIVDARDYPELELSLMTYIADIRQRLNDVELIIYRDDNFKDFEPSVLRQYLADRHYADKMKGFIFVGRMPFREWEETIGNVNTWAMNPLYYEDLDGFFKDTDENARDDYHGFGTNSGPEVFVSWIYPKKDGEIDQLNSYFAKVHDFYTHQLPFRQRSLVMANPSWLDSFMDIYAQSLEKIYQQSIDRDYGGVEITGELFIERTSATYQTIVLFSDESSIAYLRHGFGTESFYKSSIETMVGGGILMVLGSGGSGALHKTTLNVTATSYLFGSSIAISSVSTVWQKPMSGPSLLIDHLADGDYLGSAWLKMRSQMVNEKTLSEFLSPSPDTNTFIYGDILFGDPFLTLVNP